MKWDSSTHSSWWLFCDSFGAPWMLGVHSGCAQVGTELGFTCTQGTASACCACTCADIQYWAPTLSVLGFR